ncbi:SGNH/GDSL hydrolase family protein [Parvibium lacunae]|uniref:GDSL family lipase n=1 Tax=Parvibium lacunae TaxID=1888893 RepID=A0A368L3R7_9BURK|nr:SGNH/GDSL hydrolase family protein [Parvibium lacunae]RCS58062.1 hypothetical protein DU000_04260 [Parvibium lacunae]
MNHSKLAKTRRQLGGLALLSSLALVGCGGGGGGGSTSGNGSPAPASQFVVFGDSLSDAGTYVMVGLAKAGTVNGKTYSAAGRFTTNPGKTWVEYLAERYGTVLGPKLFTGPSVGPGGTAGTVNAGGTNYAQGGARVAVSPGIGAFATNTAGDLIDASGVPLSGYTIVGSNCVPTVGTPVSTGITATSITSQIDSYLADNPTIPADKTIIISGGANDIFVQLTGINKCTAAFAAQAQANVVTAAGQLVTQINRLLTAGAARIVIGTLPDLSKTPLGLANPTAQTFLQGMSQSVINNTLVTTFTGNTKVQFARMDTFLNNVLASPSTYGITVTNTATACDLTKMYTRITDYATGGTPSPANRTTSALACNEIDYVTSNAASTYIFADTVHPSSTIHQQFANNIYTQLRAAGW